MGFEINKFRDSIKEIDWEKSSAPNIETEEGLMDYGDYVVIDNFLQNPDDLINALLACPADYIDKVATVTHKEEGKFPYGMKDPGINQLLVPHYMTPLLFGVFKNLVDSEFIPADCNANLEGDGMKKFLIDLPKHCSTIGNLMYDGCICSVNANVPSFSQWDYNGVLFLNDSQDSEWTLWDFVWNDKAYSTAEDIMEESSQNPELVQDMGGWLNEHGVAKEESQEYEKYKDSDHFMQTRSVEAVKNRLVLFRGHCFSAVNFSGNDELYTLQLGMNEIQKPQSQKGGNEFQNDDAAFQNDDVYS